jgi:Tol biopolymer transport system component
MKAIAVRMLFLIAILVFSVRCSDSPSDAPVGDIVFTSSENINENIEDIFTMNTDGSNLRRLTNNLELNHNPSWSSDHKKIVFESLRDGNFEIYVMNADGSNQTRLTNNEYADGDPSYSPDDQKIMFVSNRDRNFQLFLMDADGSNQMRIPVDTNGLDTTAYCTPAWSPDGNKIVFAKLFNWSHVNIWIMDVDGSNQLRLTNNSYPDYCPSFSPDGSKIAFDSFRDGNRDI